MCAKITRIYRKKGVCLNYIRKGKSYKIRNALMPIFRVDNALNLSHNNAQKRLPKRQL